MPTIVIFMREGRTIDQKRTLVKNVTDAVVESLGEIPERVHIQLIDQKNENAAHGGILRYDRDGGPAIPA